MHAQVHAYIFKIFCAYKRFLSTNVCRYRESENRTFVYIEKVKIEINMAWFHVSSDLHAMYACRKCFIMETNKKELLSAWYLVIVIYNTHTCGFYFSPKFQLGLWFLNLNLRRSYFRQRHKYCLLEIYLVNESTVISLNKKKNIPLRMNSIFLQSRFVLTMKNFRAEIYFHFLHVYPEHTVNYRIW